MITGCSLPLNVLLRLRHLSLLTPFQHACEYSVRFEIRRNPDSEHPPEHPLNPNP